MTMIRTFIFGSLLIASAGTSALSQVLSFPGADGFGKYTSGGRGGRVLFVSTLADNGPGSLREAVNEDGARTIIFRVSGTIALESDLVIRHGNLTIAGQTAPGDGICVRNYPTIINADNIIIRFVRFRLGDERQQAADAMMGIGRKDIIIDHCSFSWGMDETATFYNNENFTLQWSIISESLADSYHPKGKHGYGAIWGGYRATFHHNLLAHHTSRNPRFQGGRGDGWEDKEEVDFRNNVVFNWGFECAYGGEKGKQNVVANYFKPGPATLHPATFLEVWDDEGTWYVDGNIVEGHPKVADDNWVNGVSLKDDDARRSETPFLSELSATQTAEEAYHAVLLHAGAALPRRDTVDRRIIAEVQSGRPTYEGASYRTDHPKLRTDIPLGIIDSQTSVGGWPDLRSLQPPDDTDMDGIPDAWERAHGLDPDQPADARSITDSGYSNLELFLNALAEQSP